MDLETLLKEQGFVPSHPVISWDETLDGLGVEFDKERRKKLLQVLGVAPALQGQIRQLDMTEASLRALAKLEPEDQARLVEEMTEDPDLARKIRRISHAVRTHDYGLEEAIAEARGEIPGEHLDGKGGEETAGTLGDGEETEATETGIEYFSDEALADLVVQFMDAAHIVKNTLEKLRETVGERPFSTGSTPFAFPEPWGQYVQKTLRDVQEALYPWNV